MHHPVSKKDAESSMFPSPNHRARDSNYSRKALLRNIADWNRPSWYEWLGPGNPWSRIFWYSACLTVMSNLKKPVASEWQRLVYKRKKKKPTVCNITYNSEIKVSTMKLNCFGGWTIPIRLLSPENITRSSEFLFKRPLKWLEWLIHSQLGFDSFCKFIPTKRFGWQKSPWNSSAFSGF